MAWGANTLLARRLVLPMFHGKPGELTPRSQALGHCCCQAEAWMKYYGKNHPGDLEIFTKKTWCKWVKLRSSKIDITKTKILDRSCQSWWNLIDSKSTSNWFYGGHSLDVAWKRISSGWDDAWLESLRRAKRMESSLQSLGCINQVIWLYRTVT